MAYQGGLAFMMCATRLTCHMLVLRAVQQQSWHTHSLEAEPCIWTRSLSQAMYRQAALPFAV